MITKIIRLDSKYLSAISQEQKYLKWSDEFAVYLQLCHSGWIGGNPQLFYDRCDRILGPTILGGKATAVNVFGDANRRLELAVIAHSKMKINQFVTIRVESEKPRRVDLIL